MKSTFGSTNSVNKKNLNFSRTPGNNDQTTFKADIKNSQEKSNLKHILEQ